MRPEDRAFSRAVTVVLSALTASIILLATSAGAQDLKVLARFKTGEIRLTHGGTAYTFPLAEGKLESMTLSGPGTPPQDIRMLSLAYVKDGDRVEIVLSGVTGPATLNKRNIVTFSVLTPGGHSVLVQKAGDCTFTLKRADTQGVDGTATCTGEMSDLGGKKGLPVDGVKFSAGQ